MNVVGALGGEADKLEEGSENVGNVGGSAGRFHGSLPRHSTGGGTVESVLNLEASLLGGSDALLDGAHLWERVTLGNTIHCVHMRSKIESSFLTLEAPSIANFA